MSTQSQCQHISDPDETDEEMPALESVSDPSESEDDSLQSIPPSSATGEDGDDGNEHRGRGERGTNEMSSGEMVFRRILLRYLRTQARKRKWDYARAHVLMDGLESVSNGLLSRYQVVRDEDRQERVSCIVCLEPLDLNSSHNADVHDPSEPIQTENKNLLLALPYYGAIPEVVAFPCLHLFHSKCLYPWLVRKTTCPLCRFDVDPNSLALKGGSVQRPWVPPQTGVLEAWVQAEEEKMSSCPGLDNGPEAWA
jgi:hypothetical protein